MKKIISFLILCSLSFFGKSHAQTFDSVSYKKMYKEVHENPFFDDSLTDATKIAGLSKAWAEAKFNFANFDLIPTVNWDSIYHAYIPVALAAKTTKEYYQVLTRFYTHLNDGHTTVMPPKELWNEMYAAIPIRAKLMNGAVVVTNLFYPIEEYQLLKPGTIITEINGQPVQEYSAEHISPYSSHSTPQDSLARLYSFNFTRGALAEHLDLEIVTPEGERIRKSFKRIPAEVLFSFGRDWTYRKINNSTGLFTINTFNDAALIPYMDSIFQKTPHPENLIIDLRNNGGGNSNNGFELIAYLTDQPFMTGKNILRHYRPTMRAWNTEPDVLEIIQHDWKPYKGHSFKGKVVVLSGPGTYSAAEDFLSAFKHLKRGIIIGETTGGSTGQPLMYPLPFGGMGIVCSKRDLMPDGTEFVGKGIKPDFEVKLQLKNFLDRRDDVLEEAIVRLK